MVKILLWFSANLGTTVLGKAVASVTKLPWCLAEGAIPGMNHLNVIRKRSSSTGWVSLAKSRIHRELKEKLCQQAEQGTQPGTNATAAGIWTKTTSASRAWIATQKARWIRQEQISASQQKSERQARSSLLPSLPAHRRPWQTEPARSPWGCGPRWPWRACTPQPGPARSSSAVAMAISCCQVAGN